MASRNASSLPAPARRKPRAARFFAALGRYFSGAWRDLREGDRWVKLSAVVAARAASPADSGSRASC